MRYEGTMMSPCYDVIPFFAQLILMMCTFCDLKCNITQFPTFSPNEYLFSTHADKGKEKWEIYAWAIRDILAKYGKLEKCEMQYREKLRYECMLGYRKVNVDKDE